MLNDGGFWMKFRLLLPSATKLRQGNIFTGVCQSFCSQEGGVSQHALGRGMYPSMHWVRHPPGQIPPGQTHPGQTPPAPTPPRTEPPWADTPSLADTPTPTATAAEGTHPTGMHSCCVVFLLL